MNDIITNIIRSCAICRTSHSCDIEMRLMNGNYITILKLPRKDGNRWKMSTRKYLHTNPDILEGLFAKCAK